MTKHSKLTDSTDSASGTKGESMATEIRSNGQPFYACPKCWHTMTYGQVHDQAKDRCPKCKKGNMVQLERLNIPAPSVGSHLLCLVCAYFKPWAIFDPTTGASVCEECRARWAAQVICRECSISEYGNLAHKLPAHKGGHLFDPNFRRTSQNQTLSSGVEGAHEGTTADESGSREPEKLNNAQKCGCGHPRDEHNLVTGACANAVNYGSGKPLEWCKCKEFVALAESSLSSPPPDE